MASSRRTVAPEYFSRRKARRPEWHTVLGARSARPRGCCCQEAGAQQKLDSIHPKFLQNIEISPNSVHDSKDLNRQHAMIKQRVSVVGFKKHVEIQILKMSLIWQRRITRLYFRISVESILIQYAVDSPNVALNATMSCKQKNRVAVLHVHR